MTSALPGINLATASYKTPRGTPPPPRKPDRRLTSEICLQSLRTGLQSLRTGAEIRKTAPKTPHPAPITPSTVQPSHRNAPNQPQADVSQSFRIG